MSIIPMAEDRTHESVVGCAWLVVGTLAMALMGIYKTQTLNLIIT